MKNDLFPEARQLSPRLQWKAEHGILTHFFPHAERGQQWMAIRPLPEDAGLSIAECMARHCRIYDEGGLIGYGDTQEESERDLAAKLNLPLWNETVKP